MKVAVLGGGNGAYATAADLALAGHAVPLWRRREEDLAPIRAAVETLRRLRARDDPAFDDYFDEATVTVLDEVVRIANIVTELTKFARLPPPTLEPVDLSAVAKGVVTLHSRAGGDLVADVSGERRLADESAQEANGRHGPPPVGVVMEVVR